MLGQFVDGLDHHKDTESDDQEVDDILQEHTILHLCIFDLEAQVGEIDSTRDDSDDRHENVVHERRDNLAESTTNDDT